MNRRLRKTVALLTAGVLIVATLTLIARAPPSAAPLFPRPGLVTRVYDGDTIQVSGVGRVRLLGIDALNSHSLERITSQARYYEMPRQRVRYWAERAEEFTRERLLGRRVELHEGPRRFDVHGRRLAYVHLPEEEDQTSADFNLLMIRQGLAAAYRRFEHPRREQYLEAERRVRAQRKGIWQDARRWRDE